ncbi:SH3-like domain-containing protein [Rhodospirillaceae bacterium SYSU D60014]|uniref:SH3-like domain-containing protein n=1 Tax=Virgifigura deserti TaxID=2268457 RepID=UPI000E66F41A
MRGIHDLGGLPDGPIDRSEHDYALWEKRIDAMMVLLGAKGVLRVDERRRAIEGLGAEAYGRLSYYEKWLASATTLLIEKGVFTVDELGRKMAEIEARAAEEQP